MKTSKITVLSVITLFAVITLSLSPVFRNEFVNLDDYSVIVENKDIHSLSWKNISTVLTKPLGGEYRPLTYLSYMLQYKLFGPQPAGFHVTSLLLHLINVLLVLLLANLVFPDTLTAFFAAALFGLHPLASHTVAWAAGQDDLLYTMFYLLSILSYIKYKTIKMNRAFVYTNIFFVLSLLSKPLAITLPAVLLAIDFYYDKRITLINVREKWFMLTASVFGSLFTAATMDIYKFDTPSATFLLNKLIYSAYEIVILISGYVSPWVITCMPEPPVNSYTKHFITVITLLSLLFILIYTARKKTILFLFYTLFVLTFIPLLRLFTNATMYHRMYLPSIGLSLFFTGIINVIDKKYYLLRNTGFIFLLSVLALMSFQHTKIWRNSLTLWSHQLQRYPESALGYTYRGYAYFKTDNYPAALQDYDKSIGLYPLQRTYFYRGLLYFNMREYKSAVNDFTEIIDLKYPNSYKALVYRGISFYYLGKYQNTVSDLSTAIFFQPNFANLYYNRSRAYAALGMKDAEQKDILTAQRIGPSTESGAYDEK
ncbi:MAG: tetratricopeptide repeat protein [Elusimicrobiota bacterium]